MDTTTETNGEGFIVTTGEDNTTDTFGDEGIAIEEEAGLIGDGENI